MTDLKIKKVLILVISQVLYMMKMLQGAPYSFEYPIHVAIKNTDKALALFIIENKAVYLGKNSSGSNSLQLAAVSKFHKKKIKLKYLIRVNAILLKILCLIF